MYTRIGASLSDKQVAQSVLDGKRVEATLPNGQSISGYVFGRDDYHWAIATPDGETVLVHKSIPALRVAANAGLHMEPRRDDLEQMISPFRQHLLNQRHSHPEGRTA